MDPKHTLLINSIKKDVISLLEEGATEDINTEMIRKYLNDPLTKELAKEPYNTYTELSDDMPLVETAICQDVGATNPREDSDNFGTMWCSHSKYRLGDKDAGQKFIAMLKSCPGVNNEDLEALENIDLESPSDRTFVLKVAEKYNAGVVMPLYLYSHGGIRLSTSSFGDKWDSWQEGVIFISNQDLSKEAEDWGDAWRNEYHTGKTDVEIAEYMLSEETSEYDDYLNGNTWRYDVKEDDNTIASCGGYHGATGKAEAASDANNEAIYKISKNIINAIVSSSTKTFREELSMDAFKSKVAGEYDGELFGAIQMIAKAAEESGVSASTIFKGIAEADNDVIALFSKR